WRVWELVAGPRRRLSLEGAGHLSVERDLQGGGLAGDGKGDGRLPLRGDCLTVDELLDGERVLGAVPLHRQLERGAGLAAELTRIELAVNNRCRGPARLLRNLTRLR